MNDINTAVENNVIPNSFDYTMIYDTNCPETMRKAHEQSQTYKKSCCVSRKCQGKCTVKAKNPGHVVVYFIMKLWPLAYMICDMFFKFSTVVTYICVFVGCSVDFYYCTKIGCRYLARFRYLEYNWLGQKHYYYEMARVDYRNKCEYSLFWIFQFVGILYWLAVTIGYIFTIQFINLPITIVAFVVNLGMYIQFIKCWRYFYIKWKKETQLEKKKIYEMPDQNLQEQQQQQQKQATIYDAVVSQAFDQIINSTANTAVQNYNLQNQYDQYNNNYDNTNNNNGNNDYIDVNQNSNYQTWTQ